MVLAVVLRAEAFGSLPLTDLYPFGPGSSTLDLAAGNDVFVITALMPPIPFQGQTANVIQVSIVMDINHKILQI